MGSDEASPLSGRLTALAWSALRALLIAWLPLTLLGFVLAGVTYYVLRDHTGIALFGAVLAAVEGLILSTVFASRFSVTSVLAHALRTHRLGRLGVRMVFTRVLGISEDPSMTRAVEHIAAERAETMLTDAVHTLQRRPRTGGVSGWLRRRLEDRLLASVESYGLARLHEHVDADGKVDFVRLQGVLEEGIDGWLIERLHGGQVRGAVLVASGLLALVALQTYALHHFVN